MAIDPEKLKEIEDKCNDAKFGYTTVDCRVYYDHVHLLLKERSEMVAAKEEAERHILDTDGRLTQLKLDAIQDHIKAALKGARDEYEGKLSAMDVELKTAKSLIKALEGRNARLSETIHGLEGGAVSSHGYPEERPSPPPPPAVTSGVQETTGAGQPSDLPNPWILTQEDDYVYNPGD